LLSGAKVAFWKKPYFIENEDGIKTRKITFGYI
jgi:hypothetical protein